MLKYQGWTILTPIAHTDSSTGQARHSTVIRTLSRITPVSLRSSWASKWEKEFEENAKIPEWDRNITAKHQVLENLLLEHHVTV